MQVYGTSTLALLFRFKSSIQYLYCIVATPCSTLHADFSLSRRHLLQFFQCCLLIPVTWWDHSTQPLVTTCSPACPCLHHSPFWGNKPFSLHRSLCLCAWVQPKTINLTGICRADCFSRQPRHSCKPLQHNPWGLLRCSNLHPLKVPVFITERLRLLFQVSDNSTEMIPMEILSVTRNTSLVQGEVPLWDLGGWLFTVVASSRSKSVKY